MLQSILTKVLTKAALDYGQKKDEEFIENYSIEQPDETVVFKGYEYQYLENLAAAARMMKISKTNASLYYRVLEFYTLYYDDCICLNNY